MGVWQGPKYASVLQKDTTNLQLEHFSVELTTNAFYRRYVKSSPD